MEFLGDDGVIHHFLLDCQVRGLAPLTTVSYRHHLDFLANLLASLCGISDLEQVTVIHLRKCVQHISTVPTDTTKGRSSKEPVPLSVSSVRGYIRVWKAFFNWCYQEELIDKNPVERLKLPRPSKRVIATFGPEHIDKILSWCDLETEMGFRDYIILLLLLDTGMRLSEIADLKVSDVHDTYVKVMGKGRKEREIGIHPNVSKLLWKYIHKFRCPSDPNEVALFIAYKRGQGLPLDREGVRGVIRRLKKALELEGVRLSPHTFRHTFAKEYLNNGGDLFKLSREMGHSDIQITKMYLEDFGSSEARKQHAFFSPISRINIPKQQKRILKQGQSNRKKKK